eukprot:CAMPEP_0174847446 /NCGR_PEP_ID=MMETSP1114-20130205/12918_1 /TAXON_ID=312471 /ORGANISM="Neobodo designis, Strain CCAP 1951/1" /LENGTH=218 /DNA_ID=CAMNT_0016081725 /DNA_START=25 /DNA_END=678 /DNA_ORIENTATION=-
MAAEAPKEPGMAEVKEWLGAALKWLATPQCRNTGDLGPFFDALATPRARRHRGEEADRIASGAAADDDDEAAAKRSRAEEFEVLPTRPRRRRTMNTGGDDVPGATKSDDAPRRRRTLSSALVHTSSSADLAVVALAAEDAENDPLLAGAAAAVASGAVPEVCPRCRLRTRRYKFCGATGEPHARPKTTMASMTGVTGDATPGETADPAGSAEQPPADA